MRGRDMQLPPRAHAKVCPLCGEKGKEVKAITILSLLTDEAKARLSRDDGFRLCSTSTCDVSYYHPDTGERFGLEDVRVSIGHKQGSSPHTICYCFNHTKEEIETEVAREGVSKIHDIIREKCGQGQNRCEETNPQGACCLGNVRKAVEEAKAKYPAPAAGRPPVEAAVGAACCAAEAQTDNGQAAAFGNPRAWAMGGAIATAVLSSVCCWLPFILIASGASAAGVSSLLEAYRPYLLGATGLLLATGFYLVYFRKERCEPGGACEAPRPRLKRFNKIMIWVSTVIVLLFALFPNYAGYLLGGANNIAAESEVRSGESLSFRIEGMTCNACARQIEINLMKVPGVSRAEVSYEAGIGKVFFTPGATPPSNARIQQAIEKAGYRAFPVRDEAGDDK